MSDAQFDRALGALYGLAIGDALGMPTQMMSYQQVREQFHIVTDFNDAAPDHPLAAGMAAGSITDDTEQALVLAAELIANNGQVDPYSLSRALLAWEDTMRAKGSLDLLGPSTKAAIALLLAGTDISLTGRFGTTNGAAMRIAPVGIVCPIADPESLIDQVEQASKATHNTGLAIAAASAVAFAISSGVSGNPLTESLDGAVDVAERAAGRGYWVAGADIAARIRLARSLAHTLPGSSGDRAEQLALIIGTSLASQESIPLAFGLLELFPNSPWQLCCEAATLGGDSDTVAAIAGAILGAHVGRDAFPPDKLAILNRVNALDLAGVATQLLALRP